MRAMSYEGGSMNIHASQSSMGLQHHRLPIPASFSTFPADKRLPTLAHPQRLPQRFPVFLSRRLGGLILPSHSKLPDPSSNSACNFIKVKRICLPQERLFWKWFGALTCASLLWYAHILSQLKYCHAKRMRKRKHLAYFIKKKFCVEQKAFLLLLKEAHG